MKQWRDIQDQRSKSIRSAYEQYRKDLMNILNKKQRKKYEELYRRPATGAGGASGVGRVGVARNWTQLGVYGQLKLSEEQQKKLGAAHQAYSKASTAIYQNKELSAQEKRTQMGKAIADYQAAHNKILTEAQQKKLNELRRQGSTGPRLKEKE